MTTEASRPRPIVSGFDGSADALLVIGDRGLVVDANAAACTLFRVERGRLLGSSLASLGAPVATPLAPENLVVLASPAGLRTFSVAWHASRGDERFVVLRDVSDRIRDERARDGAAAESRHLEALARLAGGIAHDFNNILAAIRGFADVVHEDLPADSALRDDVAQILDAAERATELTRQLLVFGRRRSAEPRTVDANALIAGLGPLLRNIVGERSALDIRLAPRVPSVWIDPTQLEQSIAMLVQNARDAIAERGTIRIETSELVSSGDADPDLPAGTWLVIAVKDDGHGMDGPTRARMFDPFFTTKAHAKTEGLGLSMVFGMVRASSGHVRVETSPGDGTTVRLLLPESRRPQSSAATAGADPSLRGTETILVLEDDPIVRRLVLHVLRRFGYTALEATSAAHAIELCARETTPIHALLTDVAMPDMSGPAAVARIRSVRAELPVVYMSGHPGDLLDADANGSERFVQKPFTPVALATAIRAALDGRR